MSLNVIKLKKDSALIKKGSDLLRQNLLAKLSTLNLCSALIIKYLIIKYLIIKIHI